MALDLTALTVAPLNSVSELMNWASMFRAQGEGEVPRQWGFRGQPQVFNSLKPSLSRSIESAAPEAAFLIERKLLSDFRTHYAGLPDRSANMPEPSDLEGYDLRCLSVMQHYEVPTRLLDWTSDIWIALFFACASDPGNDAELWFYDRSILTGQDLPPTEALQQIEGHLSTDPTQVPRSELNRRLLAEVLPRITPRMNQQAAHHTVAASPYDDHAQLLNDLAARARTARDDVYYFRRFTVTPTAKPKMLQFLADHKNLTAGTIFPDVVGLSRYLRWQFESLRRTLT